MMFFSVCFVLRVLIVTSMDDGDRNWRLPNKGFEAPADFASEEPATETKLLRNQH